MITKDLFVELINSLREQHFIDYKNGLDLSNIFNSVAIFYDNSILVNAIFSVFKNFLSNDMISEIQSYCYEQNFGRIETEDSVTIETPEELFERLSSVYKLKTN